MDAFPVLRAMLPVCHDDRGAEELVGEETPGEVALPLKMFEPSKNGSPLSPKMDEPWAYVPVARTAPGAEDARERMEIWSASFV
jgi:hypothetical protein